MYPDELLYSLIARYHFYSLNNSTKQTANELFGLKSIIATPDLPINIKRLYDCIKIFSEMTIEELISKHTFFNFYTTFIDSQDRDFVKSAMVNGQYKGAIHMKTGVMASTLKEKKYFYYCTKCVKEEINHLGESIWHLSHQLPGVLVCIKHKETLKESNIAFRSKHRFEFYTPPVENDLQYNTSVGETIYDEKLLLIANECIELATQNFSIDMKELQKIYKGILFKKGYISRYRIDQQKLASDFEKFYGRELLDTLQSSINYDNPSCWLKAITRKHKKTFHPIRHILLIQFFQESLSSIQKMQDNNEPMPFGKGPFPCLNKAADHFKELVITNITKKVCGKTKLPVGVFKCNCGYHYSRKGPDTNQKELYKIGRVIQYGEVWTGVVHKLININKLSYSSVARHLGVDTNTIIKYSRKKITPLEKKEDEKNVSKMISDKQKEWLGLISEYGHLGVTKMREMNPALYGWLYRNCKVWLQINSPKKANKINKKRRINWEKRDRELANQIEAIVKDIMERKPPKRVTIGLIGREINKQAIIEKHMDLLPITKKLMMKLVEDIPTFQIRRINYIANQLNEQNVHVPIWMVRRKAGLKGKLDFMVEEALKQI
nr:TnsD family transposase [Bacillus sp. ISL-39]